MSRSTAPAIKTAKAIAHFVMAGFGMHRSQTTRFVCSVRAPRMPPVLSSQTQRSPPCARQNNRPQNVQDPVARLLQRKHWDCSRAHKFASFHARQSSGHRLADIVSVRLKRRYATGPPRDRQLFIRSDLAGANSGTVVLWSDHLDTVTDRCLPPMRSRIANAWTSPPTLSRISS
jgi:hypothetical protein